MKKLAQDFKSESEALPLSHCALQSSFFSGDVRLRPGGRSRSRHAVVTLPHRQRVQGRDGHRYHEATR